MKCKYCGKEFISLFSSICPYCGKNNSVSLFDALFGSENKEKVKKDEPKKVKDKFDPYDWNNPDNSSDREYLDDDDYDDFDN